jgi:carboxypeptidase PM20D1
MRRALGVGLAILVLGAAVLVGRAALLPSRQLRAEPVARPALDEAGIVERFRAALRFRTVAHPDPASFPAQEFESFRAFLAASFPRLHAALARELVAEHTLLFTWRGADPEAAPVVLMGHQDVVPAESPESWTHPPFAGELVDGVLWGRGALDDKPNVMGLCEAVEHLIARGFRPERTVVLLFGHDEELGGTQGAAPAARLLAGGPEPFLVLDEGGAVVEGAVPFLARPVAVVGVAEKGSLNLELVARLDGPAHSSTPPALTSVGRVARAVDRLQSRPFPTRTTPGLEDLLRFLAPELPLPARTVAANRWLFDPLLHRMFLRSPATAALVRTTTAPTVMRGGTKANVIPPEASITVNFRILTGESVASTTEHVRRAVADPAVELRAGAAREPSPASPVDTPGFAVPQRTIAEVFPDAVVAPYLITGGTDARYFHELSPSVYRFQPGRFSRADLGLAHGVDERLPVANLLTGVAFYVRLIENAAGRG